MEKIRVIIIDDHTIVQTGLANILNLQNPTHLQHTWWKNKITGEYLEKCHVEEEFSNTLLNECFKVHSKTQNAAYLLGDSYARNYLPTIKEEFKSV